MVCSFKKLIYPSQTIDGADHCYMVAVYTPCEKLMDSTGIQVTEFKAVGYCLPTAKNLRYDEQIF